MEKLPWTEPALGASHDATFRAMKRPATRYDVGRVLATGESYTRPAHHKKGTKPRRTIDDVITARNRLLGLQSQLDL